MDFHIQIGPVKDVNRSKNKAIPWLIIESLVWDKRRRRAEMAFAINAILVSPVSTITEGDPHVFLFYLVLMSGMKLR